MNLVAAFMHIADQVCFSDRRAGRLLKLVGIVMRRLHKAASCMCDSGSTRNVACLP